ncbi:MAG: hypothetical protein IT353_16755 [Gemmatimonadaceae bacterium]|nr:hypothetical protein [Gemmatimonadaceae bacterium]
MGHELASRTAEGAVLGLRAALRAVAPLVGRRAVEAAGAAQPLERFGLLGDPPTISGCEPLEAPGARPMAVGIDPGVSAFLDGVQRSRILGHVAGAPIVFATVAAVVRERGKAANAPRVLTTWDAPLVTHLVLASRATIGESAWGELEGAGLSPVDLSTPPRGAQGTGPTGEAEPMHPLIVRSRALDLVAQERESIERRLAARWCGRETRWLWIDGGISGNLSVDATTTAFGVVKSHHTLYGDAVMMHATLALAVGERSPIFLVQHKARRAVASWYLRLHQADDGDPLHGLVRVEVAPPPGLFAPHDKDRTTPDAAALAHLSSRANEVSAWILAERGPLALPDPRWDTLTYGVYACEQYLKALIGA